MFDPLIMQFYYIKSKIQIGPEILKTWPKIKKNILRTKVKTPAKTDDPLISYG